MDCRKLSKRIFLPKGTYQSVVHSKGQVALIERRVGAAGEHREVDHVGEPPQHLLVHSAEVDCWESRAGGRGEHRVLHGENVYKVEPQ